MHHKMKLRVIILNRCKQITYFNFCCQFLPDLTFQSIFWRFPWFNLASRKLPPILPFAITTLGGEQPTILDDDGSNDFYVFP